MTYAPAIVNPLAGNPLRSRKDVQKALNDLFEPLLPFFSAGGARVSLSETAAHFDRAAADLEGFARPLWGLAPICCRRRPIRTLAPLCQRARKRHRSGSSGILGPRRRPRPAHGRTRRHRLFALPRAGTSLGTARRAREAKRRDLSSRSAALTNSRTTTGSSSES